MQLQRLILSVLACSRITILLYYYGVLYDGLGTRLLLYSPKSMHMQLYAHAALCTCSSMHMQLYTALCTCSSVRKSMHMQDYAALCTCSSCTVFCFCSHFLFRSYFLFPFSFSVPFPVSPTYFHLISCSLLFQLPQVCKWCNRTPVVAGMENLIIVYKLWMGCHLSSLLWGDYRNLWKSWYTRKFKFMTDEFIFLAATGFVTDLKTSFNILVLPVESLSIFSVCSSGPAIACFCSAWMTTKWACFRLLWYSANQTCITLSSFGKCRSLTRCICSFVAGSLLSTKIFIVSTLFSFLSKNEHI